MSCRTTSGGTISTSLARSATGLTDAEIQHLFHDLKREGAKTAPPTNLDTTAWLNRQEALLAGMHNMSPAKADRLRQTLFRARSEDAPDPGTFYAWSRIEARARQEVAVRSVTDAIDLDPPGSHAADYEIGPDGRPARIYYASYGSNLNRDRFMTYLAGGTPPGSTRTYTGCTDTTEPTDDIGIRFAGARPHFALRSRVWTGGIAFVDPDADDDNHGLGRAYNITTEQFDQVVAQENGGTAKTATALPLDEVLTQGRATLGPGAYETVVHIGDYNGAPVLTFTAPFTATDAISKTGSVTRGKTTMPVNTNKPSAAYCYMIGRGLQETFGMDAVAAADYLRGCPGGDRWERRELVKILRSPTPPAIPAPATRAPARAPINYSAPTFTSPGTSYYPAVRRYRTIDEQNTGLATWRQAVTDAEGDLAAHRSALIAAHTALEEHPTGGHPADRRELQAALMKANNDLDIAQQALNEANAKYDQAAAQTPPAVAPRKKTPKRRARTSGGTVTLSYASEEARQAAVNRALAALDGAEDTLQNLDDEHKRISDAYRANPNMTDPNVARAHNRALTANNEARNAARAAAARAEKGLNAIKSAPIASTRAPQDNQTTIPLPTSKPKAKAKTEPRDRRTPLHRAQDAADDADNDLTAAETRRTQAVTAMRDPPHPPPPTADDIDAAGRAFDAAERAYSAALGARTRAHRRVAAITAAQTADARDITAPTGSTRRAPRNSGPRDTFFAMSAQPTGGEVVHPRTDGDQFPGVVRYTTIDAQRAGVAAWSKRIRDNEKGLSEATRYLEKHPGAASVELAVKTHTAAITEARAKHTAATNQQPTAYYHPADSHTPDAWQSLATHIETKRATEQARLDSGTLTDLEATAARTRITEYANRHAEVVLKRARAVLQATNRSN